MAPLMLDRRPEARGETVEALVEMARRGKIRIPVFQRGLKWKGEDVLKLFDSLYRGFPIGSLLLWEHERDAESVTLGHLRVSAPRMESAWSVVDGQQRLTALAASLTPSEAECRDERFELWFDPEDKSFAHRPKDAAVPDTWVPVSALLDATSLGERLLGPPFRDAPELRRAVFEAGKRIREYSVPLYVIATRDEDTLREIFHRVNTSGARLEWSEVHDALFGGDRQKPSTTREVADELALLGMGRPDEDHLLTAIMAAAGLDPTRPMSELVERHREVARDAAATATPPLRAAFDFLRRRCGVPHLRLLPHWEPVSVLGRFFATHPTPEPRSLELLARFLWRGPLTGDYDRDRRTLVRRALAAIDEDEEQSVQRLLALVDDHEVAALDLSDRFDARTATGRLCLLALTSLRPLHLESEAPIDISALIERHDIAAFPQLISHAKTEFGSSAANRLLHPPLPKLREVLEKRVRVGGGEDRVLASHAISAAAAALLRAGNYDAFLEERERDLVSLMNGVRRRYAAWNRGDRPSIQSVIAHTLEEPVGRLE